VHTLCGIGILVIFATIVEKKISTLPSLRAGRRNVYKEGALSSSSGEAAELE